MAAMKKTLALVVAFAFVFAMAAISGIPGITDRALAQEKGITVRVLLYSGRPDPAYELTDGQLVEKLKASVGEAKRLEDFKKETVIPVNIGYKGILVTNPEKRAGLPGRFAVYKGAIEVMDGQKRFLEDRGGAVEKLLMDEAIRRGVIDDVVLKRMKKDQ